MKKVYILATGGTISAAGCEGKTTGYHDGKFELKDLLARVKGAEKLAKLEGEIQKLNNTVFALKTTDIRAYPENYGDLSMNAACGRISP